MTDNRKLMALMLEKCWLHLVLLQMHASLCSHVYIAPALDQCPERRCCSLQIKRLHRLFQGQKEHPISIFCTYHHVSFGIMMSLFVF